MPSIARTLFLLPLLAVLTFTGCGGGEKEDLHVNFRYQAVGDPTRFRAYSVKPVLDGLGDNRPRFALKGGALPPGLTLNPGSGEISGVATALGTYSSQVVLTVDGYEGALETHVFMVVSNPSLWYATPGSVAAGAPFSFSVTPTLAPSVQQQFTAYDPLPTGLALDPATGELSGSLSVRGSYRISVNYTITLDGATESGLAIASVVVN